MQSSLAGRLDNTSLAHSKCLLPIFECVANSIQAIEMRADLPDLSKGHIVVDIERIAQGQIIEEDSIAQTSPIISVSVKDNGIGFTDKNFNSFKELDTDLKKNKGCRGIGRLFWLKVFQEAEIQSMYISSDEQPMLRTFRFERNKEVYDVKNKVADNFKYSTTVILKKFIHKDKKAKRSITIALEMLEHFLWYFMRSEGVPTILIKDNVMPEPINLNDLYDENISKNIERETVFVLTHEFQIFHINLVKFSSSINSMLFYCAEDRIVKKIKLVNNILGYFGRITTGNGRQGYACMIASKYLDEHVLPNRTDFDLEEEPCELFPDLLSFRTINNIIFDRIAVYLRPTIEENRSKGIKRTKDFVDNTAPRYKFLLSKVEEGNIYVDPSLSDKELDSKLHEEFFKAEQELTEEGHAVLTIPDELTDEYYERLNSYVEKAATLKQADLASYVTKRRVILQLLEILLKQKPDGSYYDEKLIHSLIMPMGKESTELMPGQENLWIIDERLVFHHYLASDKKISSYPIGATSGKEPDIAIFHKSTCDIFDNPVYTSEEDIPSAITLIEFKKPMRKGLHRKEENPMEQIRNYMFNIKDGKVETKDGRPLVGLEEVPVFCYVICDMTTKLSKSYLNRYELTAAPDNSYFFRYSEKNKAYFEVIPYDTLLMRAKQRNKAFFDKLGLPSK